MLFSANAFRRKGRFVMPGPALDGLRGRACLDSAGFVAMHRYGGYPWSPSEYLDLVAAYPWRWYAAMDLCCEPELGAEVNERIARTVSNLVDLRALAASRGLPMPMPVLQGWAPEDYARCVRLMGEAIGDWLDLVGVGSMCRRHMEGEHGLRAVVRALDAALPAHARLHLFGVKSTALGELSHHPRVASSDSMAWDFAARMDARARGVSSTMRLRARSMGRWLRTQKRHVNGGAWQMELI